MKSDYPTKHFDASDVSSTLPATSREKRCRCYMFTLVNVCVIIAIVYVYNAGRGSFVPQFGLQSVFPEYTEADNATFPRVHAVSNNSGKETRSTSTHASTDQIAPGTPAAEAIQAGAADNEPLVLDKDRELNASEDLRAKLDVAVNDDLTSGVVRSTTPNQNFLLSPSTTKSTYPSASVQASASITQTWTSSMPSSVVSSSSSHSTSATAASSHTLAPGETAKASVSATPSRISSVSPSCTSSLESNSTNVVKNTAGTGHPPITRAPFFIGGQSTQGHLATNLSSSIPESMAKHDISALPCPTLFVYPNVPIFDGGAMPSEITFQIAFGEKQNYPGIYMHSQFNLAQLVIYRLHHSKHCRVTTNASAADLFIIPALTAPKALRQWAEACGDSDLWRKSTIGSLAGNMLSFLPHLNNQTASKHVFIVSKGHYHGMGGSCDWIPGEPPFSPVFRNIQRFAYSHTYKGHRYNASTWDGGNAPLRLDGRVVSVPYPSSFHWSAAVFGRKRLPPWQQFSDRPMRVFLVARVHGRQRELRQRLANDCKAAGKPLCKGLTTFDESAMEDKQRAVFCLEPEGDRYGGLVRTGVLVTLSWHHLNCSPFRKSVYDSIVSGCIPVLFSPDSDAVSPWHWGLFRESSRVLLSESEYMAARPGVEGLRVLYDMPQKRIAELQASIARYAHRLQVSCAELTADRSLEYVVSFIPADLH